MRPKVLFFGVLFLAALPGCGGGSGDSAPPAAAGAESGTVKPVAQAGAFASLEDPGYSMKELRVDLDGVGLQKARELQQRLEAAVGQSDAAIGKLTVEMQRFAADALVSGNARAARDNLEIHKRTRVSLRNKLLVLSRHIAAQKAVSGK